MTRAAAWLIVRLRLVIVAAWIAVAYVATAHLPNFTERAASVTGGLVPSNAEATRVERRAAETFGTPLLSRVSVVQRDPAGLTPDEQKRAIDRALRIDRGQDDSMHSVAFALPVSNARAAFPSSHESGTTVVTFLYFRPGTSVGAQLALADTYRGRIRDAGDPVIGVTGSIPAREAEFHEIDRTLPRLEYATIALIAIILLVAFRALGPPLVTLGSAAVSYLISVRLLTWCADSLDVEVPREIQPILLALLLGLTTDYAVFFLAGARRRLAQGEARIRATQEATRTVLPIVVVAGLIVVVGSASLVVGELDFFRAFGPGLAITVAVTLAVSITLVPAALAILGRAMFWPGLRPADESPHRRLRGLAGSLAVRRPVAILLVVLAGGVLCIAAAEARSSALGLTLVRGLPDDSEVKRAAEAAGHGFSRGIVGPTELLVEAEALGDKRDELAGLQRLLAAEPGVAGVVGIGSQPEQIERPLFVNHRGDAARFAIVLDDEPLSTRAIHTLQGIDAAMPSMLARTGLSGARYGLAGDTAIADATVDAIHADIARIAAALLLANLVLLAIFLRALLAPLYLLAASVLALAASIGITTWIFQDHLGHQDITYYVPFAAAVLLLSLGSDYNIFISGRIWQEAERRPLREAIRTAAPAASGTIAIAGITLAGSFALLALIPIRAMRELAVVMCVGILVDTFIVRSLLVPSLMATFGGKSWWPSRPPAPQARAVGESGDGG
jgi:putative drug exporter of the RND superfamily